MRTAHVYARRRGVLLLIIMALLGMFAMMAVAFIVVTSQSRRSAEAFRDVEESEVAPREEMERAFGQVVRGSNNPASAIGSHSLLEDLYGNNTKIGQILDITPNVTTPDNILRNEVWSTPETRLRVRANRPLLEIAVRPANVNSQFPGSGALDPRFNSVTYPPALSGQPMIVGAVPIMPPLVISANGTPQLGVVPAAPMGAVTDCAGCVLTMLNGPAAGVSTRIVAVLPGEDKSRASGGQQGDVRPKALSNTDQPYVARLQILAQDELNYRSLYYYFNPTGNPTLDRDRSTGKPLAPPLLYVINGAPFSGTGFGLPTLASGTLNSGAFVPNLRNTETFVSPGTPPGTPPAPVNQPTATQTYPGTTAPSPFFGPVGGANEDYDAPDHQNMLLAMVRPPARVPRALAQFPFDWVTTVPIPSLHRADLYRYWFESKSAVHPSQVVQYTMRPLQSTVTDPNTLRPGGFPIHPRFTGSNPKFHPAWDGRYYPGANNQPKYQWDVDNDGDGVPDSVWVDLGMPVRTFRDGRRCKPLFAILCTDLDGRLNLNAHGTSEHFMPRVATLNTTGVTARYAGNIEAIYSQRGQGYGPAEINLRAVLPGSSNPKIDPYVRLLRGIDLYTVKQQLTQIKRVTDVQQFEGRYGDLEYLLRMGYTGDGAFATSGDMPLPDYPTPGFPGERNPTVANRSAAYRPFADMCPWGPDYSTNANFVQKNAAYLWRDAFGTPPSLNGNCVLALDRKGHPFYWGFAQGLGWRGDLDRKTVNPERNYALNSPYELNLFQSMSRRALPHLDVVGNSPAGPMTVYTANNLDQLRNLPTATDAPFTPGELERVLRPFDVDSSKLAARIMNLTDPQWPGALMDPTRSALLLRRHTVTTESWDLPCPPASVPPASSAAPATAAYGGNPLLRALKQNSILAALAPEALLQRAYSLFAPETVAGLRMNVNRPFGNARDDDSNGAVDEPLEGNPAILSAAARARTTASTQWTGHFNSALVPVPKPNRGNNDEGGNTDVTNGLAANNQGRLTAFSTNAAPGRWASNVQARQFYARNLYCLAYLLSGRATLSGAQSEELAQWAVNVVDFMDRDSIMTRFDYDTNPFDGWNPPTDGRQTVFGIERPELLLTETFAMHDRRMEDTDQAKDVATPPDTKIDGGQDADADQGLRPQGSLFVEVYNPNNTVDPRPAELAGNSPTGTVRLDQVTPRWPNSPATIKYGSPVWRLVVAVPFDPATLQGLLRPQGPSTQQGELSGQLEIIRRLYGKIGNTTAWCTERYVYFTARDVVMGLPVLERPGTEAGTAVIKNQATHWRNYSGTTAPSGAPGVAIPAGQYALIGPGEPYEYTQKFPKSVTYLGFRDDDDAKALDPTKGRTAYFQADAQASGGIPENGLWRRIVLDGSANRVRVYNRPPASATGIDISPTDDLERVGSQIFNRGIPVIVSQPQRLSITEPCQGYQNAFPTLAGGVGWKSPQYMWLYETQGNTPLAYINHPLDSANDYGSDPREDMSDDLLSAVRARSGTVLSQFRVVYLQRLADPTRPFERDSNRVNPAQGNTFNPYLNVDAMPVDLLVYDGAYRDPTSTSTGEVYTAERGESYPGSNASTGDERERSLWGQEPLVDDPTATANRSRTRTTARTSTDTAASFYTKFYLKNRFEHSLAYVNRAYGLPTSMTSAIKGFPLDEPTGDAGATNADYSTFPWLAWNNRPFVSQLELLCVPRANSDQILSYPYNTFTRDPQLPPYFSMTDVNTNVNLPIINPYLEGPNATSAFLPFRHLPPFFYSSTGATIAYHRLLDYVHVPSRFDGAEQQFRQDSMATPVNASEALAATTHFFRTPFNWVSAYREPGRVNLNTIFSFDVWRGLNNDAQTSDGLINNTQVLSDAKALALVLRNSAISLKGLRNPSDVPKESNVNLDVMAMWRKLALSRKGYWSKAPGNWHEASDPRIDPSNKPDAQELVRTAPPIPTSDGAVIDEMLTIDPAIPTRFANPFRSPAGKSFTTQELTYTPGRAAVSSNSYQAFLEKEVHATLLRPDPDSLFAARNAPPAPPPTDPTATVTTPPAQPCLPLFGFYSRRNYNNSQRNPTFAYQSLQRLGNLATTRSNVYAVWITMGYFEAERITNDDQRRYGILPDPLVYPDGYLLGQEVGYDTGEIRRYRSFYIIDRSIPVGFFRGQDVNFDKAVLIRRFIE